MSILPTALPNKQKSQFIDSERILCVGVVDDAHHIHEAHDKLRHVEILRQASMRDSRPLRIRFKDGRNSHQLFLREGVLVILRDRVNENTAALRRTLPNSHDEVEQE